jgi:hypothetical protein
MFIPKGDHSLEELRDVQRVNTPKSTSPLGGQMSPPRGEVKSRHLMALDFHFYPVGTKTRLKN